MRRHSETDVNRRKFRLTQAAADRAGVPFTLTYEQWREVWVLEVSYERGQKMARIDPAKGYEPGNVFIKNGRKDPKVIAKIERQLEANRQERARLLAMDAKIRKRIENGAKG